MIDVPIVLSTAPLCGESITAADADGSTERWIALDTFKRSGLAIVIETQPDLADTVCDFLNAYGYQAFSVRTHAAAAVRTASEFGIALLAASVPAPDEDRAGIYLDDAARKNPTMAVVLMLRDDLEVSEGAPKQAIRITSPFDRDALVAAIIVSEALAGAISSKTTPPTASVVQG